MLDLDSPLLLLSDSFGLILLLLSWEDCLGNPLSPDSLGSPLLSSDFLGRPTYLRYKERFLWT